MLPPLLAAHATATASGVTMKPGLLLFLLGLLACFRGKQQPDKYYKFRQMSANMRGRFELVWAKLQGKDTQIYREMNLCPPKPLQVCVFVFFFFYLVFFTTYC